MTAIFPTRAGPAATGHFAFTQAVPSATWTIAHDLGFEPVVQIFDTAGDEVEGDITHENVDLLTVTFSAAFAGVAYCN